MLLKMSTRFVGGRRPRGCRRIQSHLYIPIGDVETLASGLAVSVFSSDETLLPAGNVLFIGSGGNRTAALVPAADRSGAVTVRFMVRDGSGGTASGTFNLLVQAVNDPPVVDPQTFRISENAAVETIVGTVLVSDIDSTTFTRAITAGNASGKFSINPNGQISLSGSLDYETQAFCFLTVNVRNVQRDQTIQFGPLAARTFGDAAVTLQASSSSSDWLEDIRRCGFCCQCDCHIGPSRAQAD